MPFFRTDRCPQPVKDGQSAKAYLGKQGAAAPGPHEVIEISARGDGALFRAVVCTGARKSCCREPFARRTDNGVFRFGGHPEFTAQCGGDPPAGAHSHWMR